MSRVPSNASAIGRVLATSVLKRCDVGFKRNYKAKDALLASPSSNLTGPARFPDSYWRVSGTAP